jgi:hypothetical protein
MTQSPDDSVKQVIDGLDLEEVVRAAKGVHRWTESESKVAERRYRDFLWVCWNSVNGKVPRLAAFSRSADQVWHEHILWTGKYREDCERIFGPGRFLDHVPVYAADVTSQDIQEAERTYRQLGIEPPPDIIHECVWASVS